MIDDHLEEEEDDEERPLIYPIRELNVYTGIHTIRRCLRTKLLYSNKEMERPRGEDE